MEGIKFRKKPRFKNPYLIVAWPGMGEVAFKAAVYLVDKLMAQDFASIPAEEFFYLTGSMIKDGILDLPEYPGGKFYYWKNKTGLNDLVIFISNAQPDLSRADNYCNRIISFAKSIKVKAIISLAAMPQPVDHMQEPRVWFAGTAKEINAELKNYNLNLLSEGQISGMNGLFLGMAKKHGLRGFCLLADIPLYTIHIENPKASYAVLEALSRILKIQVDFANLIEQTHVMEAEINKLLEYLKVDSQTAGPIGEEEIERIKKSLSQLTKLPLSVKEKIEKLFDDAKKDISKANELKAELDRWNAYMEYEDRFLDLFRRAKDKSN